MLTALILAATVTATPTATPAPTLAATSATVVKVDLGHPRTLADVAAERKLGVKGVKGGTFSAAQSTVAPASNPGMTDADRWRLQFGEPERINVTLDSQGNRHEQWIMSTGSYVYFVNGKSAGYQTSIKP